MSRAAKAEKRSPREAAVRVAAKRAVRVAFTNRMIGEAMVDAKKLRDHPLNWRTHPAEQREAMREVLESVGWVQKVVVNKRTGHIIDGHLRVEEARAKGEQVPVVYVDLTAAEERKMLALFDPIRQMAGVDKRRLREVIDGVEGDGAGLKSLMASLRASVGLREEVEGRPEVPFTEELLEEYQYVVAYCDNAVDWLQAQSVLELKEVKSLRSEGKFQQIGIGRVLKWSDMWTAALKAAKDQLGGKP